MLSLVQWSDGRQCQNIKNMHKELPSQDGWTAGHVSENGLLCYCLTGATI